MTEPRLLRTALLGLSLALSGCRTAEALGIERRGTLRFVTLELEP